MFKQHIAILSLLLVLLFTACGKSSKVLSEKQMEDVLFDIHIADAKINENYQDFPTEEKKHELYASIFKKHEISQEQFDTSLIWYGAHLDVYLNVYDRLTKRYTVLSDSITARIDRRRMQTITSDTNQIYIWEGPKAFMLSSLPGKNLIDFNLDTVQLSSKEYYELTFNVLGIADSIVEPVVTFGVGLPDSAIIKREKVTGNGLFTISISSTDSVPPSHIFGDIRLAPEKKNCKVFIYDVGLYKSKKEIKLHKN